MQTSARWFLSSHSMAVGVMCGYQYGCLWFSGLFSCFCTCKAIQAILDVWLHSGPVDSGCTVALCKLRQAVPQKESGIRKVLLHPSTLAAPSPIPNHHCHPHLRLIVVRPATPLATPPGLQALQLSNLFYTPALSVASLSAPHPLLSHWL